MAWLERKVRQRMKLDPVFHWSPVDRRDQIRKEGLQPYSQPTVQTGTSCYPYICLGTNPARAWALSGDMDWVSEIEVWDLWQVRLPDHAEVRVRPFFGDEIDEIKVYSTIPANHCWLVATRELPTAVGETGDEEIINFVKWLQATAPNRGGKIPTAPKQLGKLLVDYRVQRG